MASDYETRFFVDELGHSLQGKDVCARCGSSMRFAVQFEIQCKYKGLSDNQVRREKSKKDWQDLKKELAKAPGELAKIVGEGVVEGVKASLKVNSIRKKLGF